MRVTFDTLTFNIDAGISIAQHFASLSKVHFICSVSFLRLSVDFSLVNRHQKMRVRFLTTEINLINSDANTMEMWPFFLILIHISRWETVTALFLRQFFSFQNDQFLMWENQNICLDFHSVFWFGNRVFVETRSIEQQQDERKNDVEYLNKNKITWSFH